MFRFTSLTFYRFPRNSFSLSLFLSLLIFVTSSFAQQQIKNFTKNPAVFLTELNTFMTATNPEAGEQIMVEFYALWKMDSLTPKDQEKIYDAANKRLKKRKREAGDSVLFWYGPQTRKFSREQEQAVIVTANFMLKKRFMSFPHFGDYLYTLISFFSSDQSDESFRALQTTLDKLVETGKGKKITAFLETCRSLFDEGLLYKSSSVQWKSSNRNYQFRYDSIPKITYGSLDLKCYSKKDSAIIYRTSGSYDPIEKVWYGRGGTVNWQRAGIGEDVVKAELRKYSVKMTTFQYQADSVTFYHKTYFNRPLMGKLTEKVLADVTVEDASYPRFDSYDKRLQIKEVFPNVDYEGGFSLQGGKLIGTGSKELDAYITFKLKLNLDTIRKNRERFMVAASKSFTISEDKINSANSGITIFLEDDSIYHPRLQLKFIIKKVNNIVVNAEITLIRGNEGLQQSLFFNSFHKVDMVFENLQWNMKEPFMEMGSLHAVSGESKAGFESSNYYRENRYVELMGMDEVHPLVEIKEFNKKNGNINQFYVSELASFIGMDATPVRQVIIRLANLGFLLYNFESDFVIIKDKLFEYLAYNAGKRDYDVIQIFSFMNNKPNAKLNLLNNELEINGVPQIFLSDSQNVYLYPENQRIVLKKNRDFLFSGQIHAGRFDFYGKKYYFNYDQFKIDMENVDSMAFAVTGKAGDYDEYGERKLERVRSVVEYIKGDLLIDKPGNKSGKVSFPEYPVFNSHKDSYVFYDRRSVQEGVYGRNKFYFHLEPFTIDSLDNFDPTALSFKGTLTSAGIFPDFDEPLRVQPDYSLGFLRNTPPDGFPVYGGKGQYSNEINLSHKGLRGNGILQYLGSTTDSKDYIFFPDSMNTTCEKFELKKEKTPVEFPHAIGEGTYNHWDPYKDVMFISKRKKPIELYDNQAQMFGTLALRPKGLSGQGQANFSEAVLTSNSMNFNQDDFTADTAQFRLKTVGTSDFAFSTDNVKAKIDFIGRKGDFTSNIGGSKVNFDVNQYYCWVNKFTWFMDSKDVELGADMKHDVEGSEGIKLEGSKFVSTHPDQDSLTFIAPLARYDLRNNIIAARDVRWIDVADARFFPDSGLVTVYKKARMKPFERSSIEANRVTKHHKIYNVSAEIHGRKNYSGSGYYDYVDEENKKQVIFFKKISVDTTVQTVAEGVIPDTANFTLSQRFAFTGEALLAANNPHLTFSGFSKIKHECTNIASNWFSFSAEINPRDIYIPVTEKTKNMTKDDLVSGILMSADSVYLYPTFLSMRKFRKDFELIPVEGFIRFDKESNEYRIAGKEKLAEPKLPGNMVALSTKSCNITGEGRFDFRHNLGQVKTVAVGNEFYSKEFGTYRFEHLVTVDFFFNDGALKAMSDEIKGATMLQAVDFSGSAFEKGLTELTGKEIADQLISQINLYGEFKRVPKELEHTFFLTNLKMKWNPETQSYLAQDPFGISIIGGRQVNKTVKGIVEIEKKRSGDELNIYIEIADGKWYYFNYLRGIMQAVSSNEEFNTTIKNLKSDKRKLKAEKGQSPFQFMLSNERKMKTFVARFQKEKGK
ncbi:MAG: hypothetical protein HYY40_08925 [Bacteroidetes bacterium]|nr:hypothetical protein [Bacteroidota bacterium]